MVSARLGEHVSSSTLSAHQMARAGEPVDSDGSDVWVLVRPPDIGKSYYWNRRTNSTTRVAPAGVEFVWVAEKPGVDMVRHVFVIAQSAPPHTTHHTPTHHTPHHTTPQHHHLCRTYAGGQDDGCLRLRTAEKGATLALVVETRSAKRCSCLATAQHHSFGRKKAVEHEGREVEEKGTNTALRGQMSPPLGTALFALHDEEDADGVGPGALPEAS